MAISDIRFKQLGYAALNVTDLTRSATFYQTIVGLSREDDPQAGCIYLRCSDKHHDIVLTQAAEPGLKRLGWEMESSAALEAVRIHFEEVGIEMSAVSSEEAASLGIEEAFRATEPTTGCTFEFYIAMRRASSPWEPTHTKIARLGHVVLNSTDHAATERFLLEHLNFRVSDRIEGIVTFMRCFPNPYHHSLGVGIGPVNALNHVNFMVTDLDDVGKGNNRMKQNKVPIVFGLGKHPPSESVFLYYLDPDGMTIEYSFGMEEFPEVAPREPRKMAPNLSSIDYWGGMPDPAFAKVGKLEPLQSVQRR